MKWSVAISFAFAGALGNLIDRVMYADGFLDGKVVDFLNYGWSVGNVADIYLVVAGVVLVILILMGEPFSHKATPSSNPTNPYSLSRRRTPSNESNSPCSPGIGG